MISATNLLTPTSSTAASPSPAVTSATTSALPVVRMGKTLASALLIGVAVAASSGAAAGGLSDQRGYNRCVKAFDGQGLSGVTLPRFYYINHTADSKTYYVNASAWENGNRVSKRITCETSASGRELHAVETADGRFARVARQEPRIARR